MQGDFNNCAVELSYKFEAEREGENEEDALSEVSQDKCQVVVEYLASGRQEANRKGMRCSDGQSLAAQRKFGSCSHDIADETYTKLGEEDYAAEGEEEEEGGTGNTEED